MLHTLFRLLKSVKNLVCNYQDDYAFTQQTLKSNVNTYHVRFNVFHNGSGLVWRVFENGKEHLVEHVKILVPVHDQVTVEDGKEKWNLCCRGHMTLENGVAIIS